MFAVSAEVRAALAAGGPVVALESTVITHGLPQPQNLQLAADMEATVRAHGAIPATIAVLNGRILIGATPAELERLTQDAHVRKISTRDYAAAVAQGANGGTTVAGTLTAAQAVGIRVFATGGIGGVHRHTTFDISADLPQLAQNAVIVVCAGAKSILDLAATLEYLETLAVPVIGYRSAEFPAFFARSSGLPVTARADSPAEVAAMALAHWTLRPQGGFLVANPAPDDAALEGGRIEPLIAQAVAAVEAAGVHGQAVTPAILERLNALSGGESLGANVALLKNNARLAAEIALALTAAR
jgi:pseudouridine-5'-phosphate glycosidase